MSSKSLHCGALFLCVLSLIGAIPLIGQGYESAFNPPAIGKGSGLSYKNPQVAIENGTGYVNFEMPIGPGLGGRGLGFTPAMRLHVSPKVIPRPAYEWNGALHLDPGPNMDVDCLPGGYEGVIWKDLLSVRFWSAAGAAVLPPPSLGPVVVVGGTGTINGSIRYWSFLQDASSTRSIDPGFAHWVRYDGTLAITLPTGESVAAFPMGMQTTVDSNLYSSLLTDFGYSVSEVSELGAQFGSQGWLIFPLKDVTGIEYTWQDAFNLFSGPVGAPPTTSTAPGRILVAKGPVAFEFERVGTQGEIYHVQEWREIQGVMELVYSPRGRAVRSIGYTIRRIRNRFGDSIEFSDQGLGYDAELFINGTPSAKKIEMRFVPGPPLSPTSGSVSLGGEPVPDGYSFPGGITVCFRQACVNA